MHLIGRQQQQHRLKLLVESGQSEFVAVYGRRRTGKTFLIREYFKHEFSFYTSGLDDDRTVVQLASFHAGLRQSPFYEDCPMPQTWMQAFEQLQDVLAKDTRKVKIVFIDELPWMDTANCDLNAALDKFWNMWASARKDIKLIVCGSAASWMLKTFINNSGAFYNRVTETMKVLPFSLAETREFLVAKGLDYNNHQIIQVYMAVGGIPYYLKKIEKGLNASQNIDAIFFGAQATIKNEYQLLFKSLFKNYKKHIDVVDVLFKKKKGLQRSEITTALKITDSGNFSKILDELVASDFLTIYTLPGKTKRNVIYKISDHYILFHKTFVEKNQKVKNYWINNINTPTWHTWAGLSFELTCLIHIPQIKAALGIGAIQSIEYTWANKNAQIDLIIERKDQVINLLEVKFSEGEFTVTKDYEKNLQNKKAEFLEAYPNTKSVWYVLVTNRGIKQNEHAGVFEKVISGDQLFV